MGVIEEAEGWRVFFPDDVTPAEIARLEGPFGTADWRREPHESAAFSREGWDGVLAGKKFYIAPPWVSGAAPEGRWKLELDATTAFGTGRHETTQLSIEALEEYLEPGATVLDVGCGSGVLGAAARLLGAGRVTSCDIQEDAIAATRRHGGGAIFLGSADAVKAGYADIVLANISAAVLDRLAWDLKRVVKPGGLLVISGFVGERLPACYRPKAERERGDWLCWICDAAGVAPEDAPREGLSHQAEWWL